MKRLPLGTILVGDAVQQLRRLPANSIDTAITSPPYFSLRRYGEPGEIGSEANVEQWVSRLATVADELARVLKPAGSLWLNLGDSFSRAPRYGAPRKSLVLAPERLLLRLSQQGWLVRNKVVWAKANPMPVSAVDRLSCTWEPIYLLTRSADYHFDLDAIRIAHRSAQRPTTTPLIPKDPPAWAGPLAGNQSGLARLKAAGRPGHRLGKNPGDVWRFGTSNFRGGHHATFPEALIERPLLASCPERICLACGSPWRRERLGRRLGHLAVAGELKPGCTCQADWQSGVVVDPFMGSGTTAVVAERHDRGWVGIELSADFARLTEHRLARLREGRHAA